MRALGRSTHRRVTGSDSMRGIAATELALTLTVVFGVLALLLPLPLALREKLRLERAAGSTVRFATATLDVRRPGTAGRRPSVAEVQAEALAVLGISGTVPDGFTVSVSPDPRTARPGTRITVVLSNTVDLGPLGFVLDVAGITTTKRIALTATAVAREE